MRRRMRKLILLVVAVSVLKATQARSKKKNYYKERGKTSDLGFTRCHSCNSWENQNCGLNFTVPYWLGVRCLKGEICRKTTYYENGTLMIERDCAEKEEEDPLCRVLDYLTYNATVCTCEEDYCNTANRLQMFPFFLALFLLTGIAIAMDIT